MCTAASTSAAKYNQRVGTLMRWSYSQYGTAHHNACESLRSGLCGVSCLPFNPTGTTPAESAGVDRVSVSRWLPPPLARPYEMEVYSAAVYGYGDVHRPTDYGIMESTGEYYGFVGVVESSFVDSIWVLDERFDDREDAADTSHHFAGLLAEYERSRREVMDLAATIKRDLVSANDQRRSVLAIVREHGDWCLVPDATKALLERIWSDTQHERAVCFDRIKNEGPKNWNYSFLDEFGAVWAESWQSF